MDFYRGKEIAPLDDKKAYVNFTLRIPKHLHNKIKLAAEDDLRSMNTYILKVVEDHLGKKDDK